ncbi:hypothetical protein ZWY2020_049520 [Hordeum vulgare]|nr:hypothetical protein ZWY2020_049520 [Hordeum vulgare]
MGAARRGLLLDQWRGIQEDQEVYDDHGDPSTAKHRRRRLNQAKEQWYDPRLARGFFVAVHMRAGLPPGHQAPLPRRLRRRPPRGKVHGGILSFGVFHWTAPLLPIGTVSSSPSSAPCLLSPVALMILVAFEPRSWCGSMAIVPWLSG